MPHAALFRTQSVVCGGSRFTPVVQTDSPSLGHVLERQRIEELPGLGRGYQEPVYGELPNWPECGGF